MTTDNRFSQELREERNARKQTGTLSEVITGPVADWASDFSHADPQWAADPFPIQDDLRQRCPIAHTERFGGVWLPTRYDDVAAIAHDTERFSSRAIIISNFRPPLDLAPVGGSPPISSDPPFHHDARKLLLSAFTKTTISRYEESTRAFCHSLIDGFDRAGRGRRGRGLREVHPDAGDRGHARPPGAGHRPVRPVRRGRDRRHRPTAGRARRTPHPALRLPVRPGPRPRRQPPRRPHQPPHQRRALRQKLGGPRGRHDRAAADRRHRHHLERDRRLAVAPGRAPGRPSAPGRLARAAADRAWRSSSGPMPRSRWPGWSRRTCASATST